MILRAAVVLFFAITCVARADQVVLRDGRVVEGRIVARDDKALTVQMLSAGMLVRREYAMDKVREVRTPERKGVRYAAIPVRGEIGADVTGDGLQVAIDQAKADGAQYVVLLIETDGGQILEMRKITDAIRSAAPMKVVALVKRAYSAGAIIALACDAIYTRPDAAIGSAVEITLHPDGAKAVVDEKFRSAQRAYFRAVATSAGHSDLWARGMTEGDLELAVTESPGPTTRPALAEATGAEGERVIKRKGQILALTGDEAVRYGMAQGIARTLDDVRQQLGIDAWHQLDDLPAQLARARAQAHAAREKERAEAQARRVFVFAEAQKLQKEIDQAAVKAEGNNRAFDMLAASRAHDIDTAKRTITDGPTLERRLKEITDYYDPKLLDLATERDAASALAQRLTDRLKQCLALLDE